MPHNYYKQFRSISFRYKKKSSKGIDICCINYIQENLNSSNPLRIKINSATGYLKKK